MTAIAAEMHRDPVSSCLFTHHRRCDDTRLGRATRLAHRGDVIDVDVETSSHWRLQLYDLYRLLRALELVYCADRIVVSAAARLLADQADLAEHFEAVAEQADLTSFVVVPAHRDLFHFQPRTKGQIQ